MAAVFRWVTDENAADIIGLLFSRAGSLSATLGGPFRSQPISLAVIV
jgi:hypothetical protein